MGEIPFLKRFAIVKGILKHLDPRAIITIIFFSIFIGFSAIIEIIDSVRINQFKKELKIMLIFGFIYCSVLFFLIILKAKSINYHVHHAIFSGALSLLFTNWERYQTIIWHAIFMGIVVEGINFYGIQELYLFLSGTGPNVNFNVMMIISILLTILNMIIMICYFNLYKKKFIIDVMDY